MVVGLAALFQGVEGIAPVGWRSSSAVGPGVSGCILCAPSIMILLVGNIRGVSMSSTADPLSEEYSLSSCGIKWLCAVPFSICQTEE